MVGSGVIRNTNTSAGDVEKWVRVKCVAKHLAKGKKARGPQFGDELRKWEEAKVRE